MDIDLNKAIGIIFVLIGFFVFFMYHKLLTSIIFWSIGVAVFLEILLK
ncbi:MAG: hypothetical protein BTN85_0095 [Candidatus Methanohalarchaeum thermophilum]|uniref:Uncharacterized protein n=1 Tax=Methanohalarchaeum thermophilum TaxID=1903181 RepID=A0A1Q6DTF0_METT1|nr:MAG: hypothetical protein BTN85_0095 [Candidatus Methanohalarchaeum thermophilum]